MQVDTKFMHPVPLPTWHACRTLCHFPHGTPVAPCATPHGTPVAPHVTSHMARLSHPVPLPTWHACLFDRTQIFMDIFIGTVYRYSYSYGVTGPLLVTEQIMKNAIAPNEVWTHTCLAWQLSDWIQCLQSSTRLPEKPILLWRREHLDYSRYLVVSSWRKPLKSDSLSVLVRINFNVF